MTQSKEPHYSNDKKRHCIATFIAISLTIVIVIVILGLYNILYSTQNTTTINPTDFCGEHLYEYYKSDFSRAKNKKIHEIGAPYTVKKDVYKFTYTPEQKLKILNSIYNDIETTLINYNNSYPNVINTYNLSELKQIQVESPVLYITLNGIQDESNPFYTITIGDKEESLAMYLNRRMISYHILSNDEDYPQVEYMVIKYLE